MTRCSSKSELDACADALAEAMKDVKWGDLRSRKHDGPLNSSIQRERVEGVQRAIEQGAKLLVGGEAIDRHDKGYFYEPTAVIADEIRTLPRTRSSVRSRR